MIAPLEPGTGSGAARLRGLLPALLVSAALLTACASPTEKALGLARNHGLESRLVAGDGFYHRIVYSPAQAGPPEGLHVYIEGDGRPWRSRYRIADDPTPANPLALKLMLRDPSPALYLGRPCYFGAPPDGRDCGSRWWTSHRYSPQVVKSLATALRRLVTRSGHTSIQLIGYSGGGTLAALMAKSLEDMTDTLVTVGGNLAVREWERQHGYTPLHGSLDPLEEPPLAASVHQLHFLGEDDRVIPRDGAARFVARQPDAELRVLPGYDHVCCWEQHWRTHLQQVRQDRKTTTPITKTIIHREE
jgi:pimeloyl-ACP methyl ester carboxylesterase